MIERHSDKVPTMVISGGEYLLTVIIFCKLVDSPIRHSSSHLVQIDIMVGLKLFNLWEHKKITLLG